MQGTGFESGDLHVFFRGLHRDADQDNKKCHKCDENGRMLLDLEVVLPLPIFSPQAVILGNRRTRPMSRVRQG